MKLSVVIPCYNEAPTLERLLKAVRAAPWPEIEVVVVDDCSTDGSTQMLQGALRPLVDRLRHNRIEFLPPSNTRFRPSAPS